jgi:hypothetical protein
LHLLTLCETLADHCGFGQAGGDGFAGAVALAVINQAAGVWRDVDGRFVRGAGELPQIRVINVQFVHVLLEVLARTSSPRSWWIDRPAMSSKGDSLPAAVRRPDHNPMEQVSGAARWLADLLETTTGKKFAVRGVVVFPEWFVEQCAPCGSVWVLEPKALPAFIEKAPEVVAPSDVALAALRLSRCVRSEVEKES